MRVTALGHAGLKVETSSATLLIDPWFSPEGTFLGSWFQYPDNSHVFGPSLLHPTAVIVSHEHLDHVDPWFLSHLPSSVPLVVPRYPSPMLRRKIESVGPRTVVEVSPWERVALAEGTSVMFVSEGSPMNHDSGIVVLGDGHTLLDLNDARLSAVQFRGIKKLAGGVVDLFAFQGAGASWYPMCYRYPEERKLELSVKKRSAKLSYVRSAVKLLGPITQLPFAGPPCFLDPDLFRHNAEMEGGVFPDPQTVAHWLRAHSIGNVIVLLPGDGWDLEAKVKDHDAAWSDFSFDDRWGYLAAYAERRVDQIRAVKDRYPEPAGSLWEPFVEYFERLMDMSPYFNAKIAMRVGFDIGGPAGGRWAVDFRPGSKRVFAELGECAYVLSFESRWLEPILGGRLAWEDFFLSLRFEAERHPDLYNDYLLGLLKFAEPAALDAVEAFDVSMGFGERIIVHAEGRRYAVGRFCPHAGNDLEGTGEVLPGRILRCLAHHHEFSLDTGECLNGIGLSLDVEVLDPTRPA